MVTNKHQAFNVAINGKLSSSWTSLASNSSRISLKNLKVFTVSSASAHKNVIRPKEVTLYKVRVARNSTYCNFLHWHGCLSDRFLQNSGKFSIINCPFTRAGHWGQLQQVASLVLLDIITWRRNDVFQALNQVLSARNSLTSIIDRYTLPYHKVIAKTLLCPFNQFLEGNLPHISPEGGHKNYSKLSHLRSNNAWTSSSRACVTLAT